MFPHMDIKIVFPFSHVSTISAHKVLVFGVSEHMFREVGLISAPEVTYATLVGLLAYYREKKTQNQDVLPKAVPHARSTQTTNIKTINQARKPLEHATFCPLLTTVHEHMSLQATLM